MNGRQSRRFTMLTRRKTIQLSVSHPELCKEWHPTKNDGLAPDDVVAGKVPTHPGSTRLLYACVEVWRALISRRLGFGDMAGQIVI